MTELRGRTEGPWIDEAAGFERFTAALGFDAELRAQLDRDELIWGEATVLVDAQGRPFRVPPAAEKLAPVIPIRGTPSDTRLGATVAVMLERQPRIPRTRWVDHFALWSGLGSERDSVSCGQFSVGQPGEGL